jgi:hypothetical protein
MKSWLVSDPQLAVTDLRPYFYFSRDILGPLGGAVRRLSPHAQETLQKLLHDSDAQRLVAGKDAAKLSPSDAAAVLETLCERASREDAPDLDRPPLASLFALVDAVKELRGQLVTFFSRLPESRVPLGLPNKTDQPRRRHRTCPRHPAGARTVGRWQGERASRESGQGCANASEMRMK